jgi:predicted nucleotidyltransferase
VQRDEASARVDLVGPAGQCYGPHMSLAAQPPRVRRALEAFRAGLMQRWGPALIQARLFGSRARAEADAASDVDVLVVLEHAGWSDRVEVVNLAADIGLEHDLVVSPTVFDRATYARWRRQERPLVMDIEREGIAL